MLARLGSPDPDETLGEFVLRESHGWTIPLQQLHCRAAEMHSQGVASRSARDHRRPVGGLEQGRESMRRAVVMPLQMPHPLRELGRAGYLFGDLRIACWA